MKKRAIFDAVVTILQEDSATKKDISGADPNPFRQRISEEMSEADFLYVMHSYLASFGIISHIQFYPKKKVSFGFQLRFYNGVLYVVQAKASTGLKKGDYIDVIDNQPLQEYYHRHKEFFVSACSERQYMDWAQLVKNAHTIELVRQGERFRMAIESLPEVDIEESPAFEAHYLNPDTYYMKMRNFYDEAAIASLYQQAFPELAAAKNLIIDVRVNYGGSDSLYFPLFPYALPAGQKFKDLEADEGYGMEILYTPANVAHRLKHFEEHLADSDLSFESRKMIEALSKDLLDNQDKGYLVYDDDNEKEANLFDEFVGLKAAPEKIILLTDVTCGSSGDNFVDILKKMPKVTVIGRPTLGILDYSNCCEADFGDYALLYPTSRSLAIDAGCGMTDKGVLPDIEVVWTPEHLETDVDLERALEYVSE